MLPVWGIEVFIIASGYIGFILLKTSYPCEFLLYEK
jgi:hypothetical protein